MLDIAMPQVMLDGPGESIPLVPVRKITWRANVYFIAKEKLLSVLSKELLLLEAFNITNVVLLRAVQGIAELITRPSLIKKPWAICWWPPVWEAQQSVMKNFLLFLKTNSGEDLRMTWKEQLDRALSALKDVAESEKAKDIAAKAKETATNLAQRVKEGALGAAEAFVEANSDPSAMRVHFLNADLTIVSPADGIEITRPNAGTIVVDDGAGNGLVVNASAEKADVAETIGIVTRLNDTTYDLGAEDGINVVVLKD